MPVKYEHPYNYRYAGGRQASILTLQDPNDPEVGGGIAGEISDNIEPFRYQSIVLHFTALSAGVLPAGDEVYVEVSNDGVYWFRELTLTFSGYDTQEVIFEEIKFRYLRTMISGTAVGSYLVTGFGAP